MSAKRAPAVPPPQARPPESRFLAGAALLFCLQIGLGAAFIRSAAPTYDETVHVASGYSYLATGRYRLNIRDHPPLAEMWAAFPLLFYAPHVFSSHPDWIGGRVYNYADVFLYQNKIPGGRMVNLARGFCLLTWSALTAWPLIRWAGALVGPGAALWALGMSAFCPVLVSNLALATTDGASAAFFFLTFWLLGARSRSTPRWAAAGACAGLALASKFNMVLIFPLAAAALWAERALCPGAAQPLRLRHLAAAAGAAALALAGIYRFGQLPLYWEGFRATMTRLGQGRSAFFMGEYSTTGFWLYFPAALLLKTPLPTLALAGGMTALWLRRRPLRPEVVWVLIPPAGYFLAALTSKVQIGVRHLLPVMPFLVLAAGCGAAELWSAGRKGRLAACLLGGWLGSSVLWAAPDLLAYFNESVGGPSQGWRYLVDSNLDWGQGLKALAAELHSAGDPPIYFSYFGTADPAAYGIRYLPVAFSDNVDRLIRDTGEDPARSGRVLFAVSATHLQCTYFADKTLYDWLKDRTPIRVAGRSIFLFDLTADPEGRARLADLVRRSGFPGRASSLLIK